MWYTHNEGNISRLWKWEIPNMRQEREKIYVFIAVKYRRAPKKEEEEDKLCVWRQVTDIHTYVVCKYMLGSASMGHIHYT